jgi:hypothetical protein
MGMFDDLRCERVMPDGFDGRKHGFQTKDFECSMVPYRISDEGRMLQPVWHGRDTGSLSTPAREPDKWHDMHYHGFVHFYTYLSERECGKDEGEWHGYYAKFTEGQLVEITCDDKTEAQRHG